MSKIAELQKLLGNGALHKDASGAGIFSSLGLNAINLEQDAKSLVPYVTPFLDATPRVTSEVGGTSVQWKAVFSANPGFISLPEGVRNQAVNFLEKDFSAPFKTLGDEVDVSMFAQQTGRGFEDNYGFAQFSALNAFLVGQEKQVLYGNSGPANVTGGNGYALATCNTPTVVLASGGDIADSTNVSVRCVALTPLGMQYQQDSFTNANYGTGLTPKISATSLNGESINASGGTSIISAASNVVETGTGDNSITATVAAKLGAVGYAWYVDSTDASAPSAANAVFYGITAINTVTITALPDSDNQKGNATGLSTDYSYDANAVDGLFSWTVNWHSPVSGYEAFASYAVDMDGASLTSTGGDGSIDQFGTIGSYLYDNFKTAPDVIWCASQTVKGASLKQEIQSAIMAAGSGAARLNFDFQAGTLKTGTMDVAYEWPYSYRGVSKPVDIKVHPWLPAGTILFQQINNPYPQAAGKIPSAFEVHALLDTFSILWPQVTLRQDVGVYNFIATKNYLPHCTALLQNVG